MFLFGELDIYAKTWANLSLMSSQVKSGYRLFPRFYFCLVNIFLERRITCLSESESHLTFISTNIHGAFHAQAPKHSLTRAQAMSSNLGQAGALYFFFYWKSLETCRLCWALLATMLQW